MQTLFLVAMDYEIKNIFDLSDWKVVQEKPYKIFQHKKVKDMRILKTGIGKVNAAAATQYALLICKPEKIINVGLVGALTKNIPIGEVRTISACRFFDVDVRAFGYQIGQIPQCDKVSYELKTTLNIKEATCTSGDSFISDTTKLEELCKDFPADFIDMEATAIAHTLYLNNKLQILECYKAASDYADSSAKEDFYKNEKIAFKHMKQFIHGMFLQPNYD